MPSLKKLLFFVSASVFFLLLVFAVRSYALDHIDNVTVTLDVPDTVLRITGDTFPNAFITVLVDGAVAGTMSANGAGAFDKSFTSQTPGVHSIKVYAKHLPSNTTTDTVSQNVSLQAQAETAVDFFLPSIIELNTTKVSLGETVIFSGLTIPNGNITLVVDNNLNFNSAANSSGKWNIEVGTKGFYIGTHSAFVVVHNGLGEQSKPSQKRLFSVTEPAPAVGPGEPSPPTSQPSPEEGEISVPIIDFPRNNQRFDESPITISGTGDPNTQVELYDGDRLIGSAFVNPRGEWRIILDLNKDRYDLKIRSCVEELCSDFSGTITIFYDGPLDKLRLELGQYRYYGIWPEEVIELDIDVAGGEAPYEVVVDWGDDEVERITYLGDDNGLVLSKSYKDTGHYGGIVTVRDQKGSTRTVNFSVDVRERGSLTWAIPLAIGIVGGAIISTAAFIIHNKSARSALLAIFFARRRKNPQDENQDPQ